VNPGAAAAGEAVRERAQPGLGQHLAVPGLPGRCPRGGQGAGQAAQGLRGAPPPLPPSPPQPSVSLPECIAVTKWKNNHNAGGASDSPTPLPPGSHPTGVYPE